MGVFIKYVLCNIYLRTDGINRDYRTVHIRFVKKLRYCDNLISLVFKPLLTCRYMIFTDIRVHDVITLCAPLFR